MGAINDEVRKNLLFFRKESKMTQQQLAEALGVKNNTISQWENGINKIDIDSLFSIANVFKLSIGDFYGDYIKKEPPASAAADTEDSRLKNIMECYHAMNEEGQEKVATYISDLVDTCKYKKLDQFRVGVEENVKQA